MTGFETAIPELMHGMFEVGFAGSIWLVQTIVLLATLLIITRNTSDWGQLLLPSMIGWNYFGVVFPNIFYILAVMIFVISTLSVNIVTKVISAGMQNVGEVFTRSGRTKRKFERMNIQEEMEKRKDQMVSYDLRRKKDIRELQKQYAETLKEEDTATKVLLKKLKRDEEIQKEKEEKEKKEKWNPVRSRFTKRRYEYEL